MKLKMLRCANAADLEFPATAPAPRKPTTTWKCIWQSHTATGFLISQPLHEYKFAMHRVRTVGCSAAALYASDGARLVQSIHRYYRRYHPSQTGRLRCQ